MAATTVQKGRQEFGMCEHCGAPLEFTESGYLIYHTNGCPPAPGAGDPGATPEPLGNKAALPPQLCQALGDAAPKVAEFCEMAPGVPWSAELLDDMLSGSDLYYRFWRLKSGRADGMEIHMSYEVATRKANKQQIKEIRTRILTKMPREGMTCGFACREFPFDRAGLRHAIEFTQSAVNKLRRKGVCPCWEDYTPPLGYDMPAPKRICVGTTGRCVDCILELAHK